MITTSKWLQLMSLYYYLMLLYNKRKKLVIRRYWVKPFLKLRKFLGGFQQIFLYFKNHDHEEFQNLTRMTVDQFDFLHNLVKRKLTKYSTFREPLSSELKLAAVIIMLAQGNSIRMNAWFFRIGRSTMQSILKEVCQALVESLTPLYIPDLDEMTWTKIAEEFEEIWNCPHCLGALDGYHVWLQKPPKSGSIFFNYKKFFSIVLLGLCDAFKRFTWFNLGHYGSFNDASIFMSTDLYEGMHQGTLNIPEPTVLKNSNILMPYFFVGDNIFALHKHLIKPFTASAHLSDPERIFNYRISRARINIECAFGILTKRWAILRTPLAFKLQTCELVTTSTILLHNFIITENLKSTAGDTKYTRYPLENHRRENGIDEIDDRILNNSTIQRNMLKDYFMSPAGSVTWQREYALNNALQ